MEASKCPKCGEEPQYIEHIEKWYCYGCNSYVEDEHEHICAPEEHRNDIAEIVPAHEAQLKGEAGKECKNCGAELEDLKEGKLYCFVCETYQEEIGLPAEKRPLSSQAPPSPPHEINEAQRLLEVAAPPAKETSATVTQIPPPTPMPSPAVEVHKPEPIVDRAEEEPAPAPSPPRSEPVPELVKPARSCPSCKQPMKWIDKYERHYCYACRKYAPKDVKVEPSAPSKKTCPKCKGELKFIDKYSEWYCYSCKTYPLRPAKRQEEHKLEPLVCPKCKGPVRWIDKYARYYCSACKEYAPKGFGGVPADAGEKKQCPACHETMKFVPEYNEWYCYKCKKYSLRPNKPVLLF